MKSSRVGRGGSCMAAAAGVLHAGQCCGAGHGAADVAGGTRDWTGARSGSATRLGLRAGAGRVADDHGVLYRQGAERVGRVLFAASGCGRRVSADVNALLSGWGLTLNWGDLTAGAGTAQIQFECATGETVLSDTRTVRWSNSAGLRFCPGSVSRGLGEYGRGGDRAEWGDGDRFGHEHYGHGDVALPLGHWGSGPAPR